MVKGKGIILLGVIFLFVLGITACSATDSKNGGGATYGNTAGNIANRALVAREGDWVYYVNYDDGQSLYKERTDGSEKEQLSAETECGYLNVGNGWVYFTNKDGYLLRVSTDGATQEVIWEQTCGSVNLVDDWLYFIDHSYNSQLYKMRTDGEGRQALYDIRSLSVGGAIVYDNWIYYLEGYDLYRHKLDGPDLEKVTEDLVFSAATITDDWIYYINMNDNGYLYKIRPDGTGRECVYQASSIYLNVAGEWIYFSNLSDNRYLYRVRTDGTGSEKLNEEAISGTNIAGDWVYYIVNRYDDTKADELWRMRLDGTEQEKVD